LLPPTTTDRSLGQSPPFLCLQKGGRVEDGRGDFPRAESRKFGRVGCYPTPALPSYAGSESGHSILKHHTLDVENSYVSTVNCKAGGFQEPGTLSCRMYNISHRELKSAKATGNEMNVHVELILDHVALARNMAVPEASNDAQLCCETFCDAVGCKSWRASMATRSPRWTVQYSYGTANSGHLRTQGRGAMFRNAANRPSLIFRKVCREQMLGC